MSWDSMKKAKEEGGGGKYLKLKDGESIEGTFMGEPYCFYQKFKDPIEYSSWQEGLSFRFRINFVTRDEHGQLVAKVFQGGAKVRDAVLDVKEEYGLDAVYKIKRTGSGKDDTRYTVLFKQILKEEQLKTIKTVKLNELQGKQKGAGEIGKEVFGTDSDDPFGDEGDLQFP